VNKKNLTLTSFITRFLPPPVDWGAGAQTINYSAARNRVGITGGTIAQFVDQLHRDELINLSNIIVIGHSLGAHVAANMGKQLSRARLTAIFATDPAGPLFSTGVTIDRLATEDAIFTEALHTNAGNNGFDEPITHASFYPNWGSSQPGCGIDFTGSCAHERSNEFYSESVRSARFVARLCSGYQQILARNCPGIGSGVMGGDAGKTLRGVFTLTTNSASPFAQG
jgi:pancreatic triacylglycerol lipase